MESTWTILFFCLAAGIELISVILAITRRMHKGEKRTLSARIILFGGTFLAAVVLFLGPELVQENGWLRPAMLVKAVHNAIRIFVVDYSISDYWCDIDKSLASNPWFAFFTSALFVLAPCLTFELVLSYFKNIYGRLQLIAMPFKEKCIFTELNAKSIALAESMHESDHSTKGKKRRVIIFNCVKNEQEDEGVMLIERAKAIGAILFTGSGILGERRILKGKLTFFVMNENHDENVNLAAYIRNRYGDMKNVTLYILSSSMMAELFASSKEDEQIKIRRVNEERALIYRTLYDMETNRINTGVPDLFTKAAKTGAKKTISSVIIGMGNYGEEMLKALSWFCQMDGYKTKIDAFDVGHAAEKRIRALCPELMEKSSANCDDPGDVQCEISIHSDINVESVEFIEQIRSLKDVTYVFVALDSDEENISVAVHIRRILAQYGRHPMIHAVVHNTDKAHILKDCKDYNNVEFDIQCVGDIKTQYSEPVILDSSLESEALRIHMKYRTDAKSNKSSAIEKEQNENQWEREFYVYEYYYHSSMSAALHLKARIACGLQGNCIIEDERQLSMLEHRRWNAYMRTEGYCFSGSLDKKSRNDFAKTHNLLVPFSELPAEEREKDRRISLE